jgi:hypothetical protein
MASMAVAMTAFHSVAASPPEIMPLDADHHGVHVLARGHQQRPQVLVPAVDELDHEQRRDAGARQRQQHVLEEAQGPGAVDARGLDQLVGHGQEELAEQEAWPWPRRSAARVRPA